jgi:hypothetical protein
MACSNQAIKQKKNEYGSPKLVFMVTMRKTFSIIGVYIPCLGSHTTMIENGVYIPCLGFLLTQKKLLRGFGDHIQTLKFLLVQKEHNTMQEQFF